VAVAEEAGSLLAKIVPDIQKTAGLMQEISSASKEQSVGTQQVQEAMTQLDQVIQSNSASSEQLAAAAEQLAGHAVTLREAIAFFRIEGEAPAAPRRAGERASVPTPKPTAPKAPRAAARALIVPVKEGADSEFEEF
jgi:methyl-accepting chemotaxis protein